MSHLNIVRAWKDAKYRAKLTESERASLPDHPAGLIELTGTELAQVAGGVAKPVTTLASTTCDTKYHFCTLFQGCGTGGC